MKKSKVLVDQDYIDRQTHWANCEAETLIKNVSEFQSDSRQENRKKIHECKRCFYLRGSTIAGQAFTDQDCGICSQTMTFGNTDTNVVCYPCAENHDLCVKCGGNINMTILKKNKTKK